MKHPLKRYGAALLLSAATLMLAVSWAESAPHEPANAGASIARLELQVDALQRVRDFELTPEQCAALRKQAAGTAATLPAEAAAATPEVTPGYLAALTALRDALVDGDEEKISDASDKVEELRDAQMVDTEPDIEATDAALKAAPPVLAHISASQVAAYLAEHADDVPDAWKTMLDALDQCHTDKPADYAELRSEAASQVALLLVGLDRTSAEPIEQKVGQWLDKAHALSDEDLKAKRAKLEEEARQIVGQPDSIEQVRHWMQREVADLLSNPELGNALGLIK